MKARQVSEMLQRHGLERGVAKVLEHVVERQNALDKAVNELADMQMKIIDSLDNVVNGTHMMKKDLERRLRERGLDDEVVDIDDEGRPQ